jgi:uncharacterized protein with HEPN domain
MSSEAQKKDRVIIQKMMGYCATIMKHCKNMNYEDFIANEILSLGCSMAIQQIGELSKKMSEGFKEQYSHIPWIRIRATRNVIVHGYETLDWPLVWETIKERIPQLYEQLDKILKESESKGDE